MGGGGGDGGAQKRQEETEAKKAAARSALNLQFGVLSEPSRQNFNRTTQVPDGEGGYNQQTVFDQGAYDAAMADFQAAKTRGTERDALYQTVRDNTYTAGKRGLDESRDQAARKTKFELFARGLNGGSEDINQNALLGRTYSQGLLDLGAKADLAKSQFKGDDEQTRLTLLQSVDAGMDAGSASSSAMNQMRVNADRAAATAQGTSLGNLFAGSDLIYNQSQYARGRQEGAADWVRNYRPPTGASIRGSNPNGQITRDY